MIKAFVNLLFLAIIALGLYMVQESWVWGGSPWGPMTAAVLAAVVTIGCVLSLKHVRPFGFSSVYLYYLTLGHLGIVVVYVLSGRDAVLGFEAPTTWFLASNIVPPVVLAALGIVSYGIGVMASALVARGRRVDEYVFKPYSREGFYLFGNLVVFICGVYLIVLAATGSLKLFSGYSIFREAMAVIPGYSLMIASLSIGTAFIAATYSDKREGFISLCIFSMPAVLLLISGNRGEIFYPLAAVIATLSWRGMRFQFRHIIVIVLAIFVVIPLVRDIRGAELRSYNFEHLEIGPYPLLMELGYTLRPFVNTFKWQEQGESMGKGQTYLLPVMRQVGLFFPFVERPEIEGTRYHFGYRLRGQGYSVLAEAFYNFGVAGLFVIPFLLGFGISRVGDVGFSVSLLPIAAAIFAILINNIRNAFIFVPGQVVLVLMYSLAAVMLGYVLTTISRRGGRVLEQDSTS